MWKNKYTLHMQICYGLCWILEIKQWCFWLIIICTINNTIIGENWNLIRNVLNIEDFDKNVKNSMMKKQDDNFRPECGVILEILDII